MRVVADLHVHSRYSLATSSRMEPGEIAAWAKRKGVDLVGTGDCTHEGWLASLSRALRPAGDGIYELDGTRFVASGEVSCVWREAGRGRRVHLVILAPSISEARCIGRALARLGKTASDGRPTLKASARQAVDAVWSASADATVIPAHVWTPWYSALGGRSGFESLEECFGAYAERIVAVETGLSSDPAMCRRVGSLDGRRLVSFSDAHAPDRLGREATVLGLDELSYPALRCALAGDSRSPGVAETIELFPQEGKYYHDGHRACGISLPPGEARRLGGRCPVCGRELTPGVLHRVEDLADRTEPSNVPPFVRAVPLAEVVGCLMSRGARTKMVSASVEALVARFGSELSVLVERPVAELREAAPAGLADAIAAIRDSRVATVPGYDGVYGAVEVRAEWL